jgi:hypothetical protein
MVEDDVDGGGGDDECGAYAEACMVAENREGGESGQAGGSLGVEGLGSFWLSSPRCKLSYVMRFQPVQSQRPSAAEKQSSAA